MAVITFTTLSIYGTQFTPNNQQSGSCPPSPPINLFKTNQKQNIIPSTMLYKTLALTTFLFGTANAATPACYATFSSSKSYTDSDPISRISYVTTKLKCCSKSVACAGGTSGCSSSITGISGTKTVGCTVEGSGCTCRDNGTTDTYNNPPCKSSEMEVQTLEANNYDCKEHVWCNQSGYAPGGLELYVAQAWTKGEVCDVSFPIYLYVLMLAVVHVILYYFICMYVLYYVFIYCMHHIIYISYIRIISYMYFICVVMLAGCYIYVSYLYLCFTYAQQTFVFDPVLIMMKTDLPPHGNT